MPNVDILLNAINEHPNVIPNLTRDLSGLERASGTVKQGFSGLQSAVGFGLKAAAGVGIAGIVGLGAAFSDSIGLARTQINAEKQLDAVLKSTGQAAGLTAEELKTMASSLQNVTNFGDEAIIGGQSLLLTFTNIGQDVFPRATETILDMSQALGQDMKSSAIQLGKALNDPIAGVSALSRVGVSFTDQQKEMIGAMVEAGDVAGAQALILDELAKEFGGSARAMADPAIQLSNAFGDFKEIIGGAILPIINQLAQQGLPLVQSGMQILTTVIDELRRGFEATGSPIGAIMEALDNFLPEETINKIFSFIDAITNIKNQAMAIISPIAESIGQFVSWKDVLIVLGGIIASIVIPALVSIVVAAAPVVAVFVALVAGVAALRNAWESNFGGIQEKTGTAVEAIRGFLLDRFGYIVDWWNENLPLMQKTVETVWNAIRGIFSGSGGVSAVIELFQELGRTIITVVDFFMKTTLDIITLIMQLITGDFEGAAETIGGIWNRIKETVISIVTGLGPALLRAVGEIITNVVNAFRNVDWGSVGRAIIDGIKAGITSVAGSLASAAANAAQGALNAVQGLLGSHSPSTVFAGVGRDMMEGMAQGISRYAAQPAGAAAAAASTTTIGTMFQPGSINWNIQVGPGATGQDARNFARNANDEFLRLQRARGRG